MKTFIARFRLGLVPCLVLVLCFAEVRAERGDLIILDNGNRVQCDVKELDRGKLRVKTDHMDTVYIEWEHIARIATTQWMEVELSSGERHYGTIIEGTEDFTFQVATLEGTTTINNYQAVRIAPIEKSFWDRLDGNIDLGFDYTEANKNVTLTFGASTRFRTRSYKFSSNLSTIYNDRSDVTATRRNDFDILLQRYTRRRSYWYGTTKFQTNSELSLDLRASLGAGRGHYWVQTNRTLLGTAVGLNGTREYYTGNPTADENLEGAINGNYEYFIYDNRKTNLIASLNLYPNITMWGRYRLEFDGEYRQEIVTDLNVSLVYKHSYDSDPPDESATAQNDWSVSTRLGWSY